MDSQIQYRRKFNLMLSTRSGDALELGSLRVVFSIKKTDAQTPNAAEIRIYNLNDDTSRRIRSEFSRITLQAGYESNYGVIFSGDIKQVLYGREDGINAYAHIYAGDGDTAYNYAIVNATLSAGAKQSDQVAASSKAMHENGVDTGFVDDLGGQSLPRGKVLYGMARDYLRQSTQSTESTWSIQDGKVQIIKRAGLLPSQAVVLTSKTGLVGVPEKTTDGLKVRCLLNPLVRIGGRVKLSESNAAKNDGVYRVLSVEHLGDSMGNDWYSDTVCLDIDSSAQAGEQVAKT